MSWLWVILQQDVPTDQTAEKSSIHAKENFLEACGDIQVDINLISKCRFFEKRIKVSQVIDSIFI